jgi:hypothetical protein
MEVQKKIANTIYSRLKLVRGNFFSKHELDVTLDREFATPSLRQLQG